ncbi:hypothetical protein D3C72_1383770 [compost metagenome]
MLQQQKGRPASNRQKVVDIPLKFINVAKAVLVDPDVPRAILVATRALNELPQGGHFGRGIDRRHAAVINQPARFHRVLLKLRFPKSRSRPASHEIIVAIVAAAEARGKVGFNLIRQNVIEDGDLIFTDRQIWTVDYWIDTVCECAIGRDRSEHPVLGLLLQTERRDLLLRGTRPQAGPDSGFDVAVAGRGHWLSNLGRGLKFIDANWRRVMRY